MVVRFDSGVGEVFFSRYFPREEVFFSRYFPRDAEHLERERRDAGALQEVLARIDEVREG